MNSYTVMDVSKYNIINDYKILKNSIDGIIIRCGYRAYRTGELKEDPLFKSHITNAIKAGLHVGVYFFTTAINKEEGIAEANFVADLIKNYKISFPVFIDTEMSNNSHDGRSDKLNKIQRTTAVVAFCDRIKELGYIPGIYASDSWFVTQLDYAQVEDYELWVAAYSRSPYRVQKYMGWQYTSNGEIKGVQGRVDLSHWYTKIGTSQKINKEKNPYLKPSSVLKKGMKGDAVKWLQWELLEEGYTLKIDGIFGPVTYKHVKDYQKKHKLIVDGLVGPITIAELIGQSAVSSGSNILATAAIYSAGSTDKDNPKYVFGKGNKFIVTGVNMYLTRLGLIPINIIHGECEIMEDEVHRYMVKVRRKYGNRTHIGYFKWEDIHDLFM